MGSLGVAHKVDAAARVTDRIDWQPGHRAGIAILEDEGMIGSDAVIKQQRLLKARKPNGQLGMAAKRSRLRDIA